MTIIKLETKVNAPIKRVFDLSRSIDLHAESTSKTKERAIEGRTSGLIGLGESVTWEAKHFGLRQRLTSKIVLYERPVHFRDSMQKGAFARLDHDHFFSEIKKGTLMTDVFDYDSPFRILGKIIDSFFLAKYMTEFLKKRNKVIKSVAESDEWKKFFYRDNL